jgi:hypothetical protein
MGLSHNERNNCKADWKYIRDRKQKLIEQNNKPENAKRKEHDNQVGNRVLVVTR